MSIEEQDRQDQPSGHAEAAQPEVGATPDPDPRAIIAETEESVITGGVDVPTG